MNKITAKSIREGNYQESSDFSIPRIGQRSLKINDIPFEAITGHGVYMVSEGKMEFKPILLTQEWLKRFGFIYSTPKNCPDYYFHPSHSAMERWVLSPVVNGKEYPYTIGRVEITNGVFSVPNISMQFRYVHELQNIFFDFTREELILNTDNL